MTGKNERQKITVSSHRWGNVGVLEGGGGAPFREGKCRKALVGRAKPNKAISAQSGDKEFLLLIQPVRDVTAAAATNACVWTGDLKGRRPAELA